MPTTFTDEDRAFLRTILNNPGEMTGWLAYADWLTERDDPRAEFIRLELRRTDPSCPPKERNAVIAELLAVRAKLDPDWVAIFDRPAIENCDSVFAFKCPKKWESLTGTDDPLVRECGACQKKVYYCLTLREAQNHARVGDCVALATTVPHTAADLPGRPQELRMVTAGIIRQPDPEPEPAPPSKRPWWKFW